MTQQHLIAPSPGLVQQWCDIALAASGMFEGIMQFATRAAQWGADQELEACCALLEVSDKNARDFLQSARRPKPPSLKEQALQALNDAIEMADDAPPEGICSDQADIIRRALEQLPQ
jgi:hypothetical protein